GLPTLRLIRTAMGTVGLDALAPGQWREEASPRPRRSG
ncbi:MAG TPA: pseudouridine synthase, partial [Xanthomonadaceae bacterium]|nr:pseudouridine synthase [Xanthomonadaceae bacterium]